MDIPTGDADSDRECIDRLCAHLADETLGAYARRHGKSRWADKSLPSADHAPLLARIFPHARFICLFRDCADTIASMLEASPFSLSAFSLEKYARMHPENLVLASALLWEEKITQILEFESAYSERCIRIRYEDLVTVPTQILMGLCEFLELEWHEGLVDAERFVARSKRSGRGDYKVWHTSGFTASSIGRGGTLPLYMIPSKLTERLNQLGAQIGYAKLGAGAAFTKPSDLYYGGVMPDGTRVTIEHPESMTGEPNNNDVQDGEWAKRFFGDHVLPRLKSTMENSQARIKLVVREETRPWIIDFEERQIRCSDEPTPCIANTDRKTLLALASGSLNPGVALRQSRIVFRFPSKPDKERGWSEEMTQQVDALMDLLTSQTELFTASVGPDGVRSA